MVKLNIDLPESFFQEEERDGYLVSAKIKELWAVQLDLLNEFDRVCKKHNLKYILDYGTLLGAVRHKGFIPWDDDVDVSMLREDYEKLMAIGPNEFKDPYFLQTVYSDIAFVESVTKLRRSDTCFLLDKSLCSNAEYNQGVWIDIFVFDNIPSADDETKNELQKESQRTYDRMSSISRFPHLNGDGISSVKKVLRYLFNRIRYGSHIQLFDGFESKMKKRPYSGFVGTTMFMYVDCRSIDDFGQIIYVPFENLMLPIPSGYDKLLRDKYGDYMTPVIGGSVHKTVFFDANRSYNEILKDKALMKKLKQKLSLTK